MAKAVYGQLPLEGEKTETRNNSLYLEILGNGGLFSLKYYRILFTEDKLSVFLRTGLSEWHAEDTEELDIAVIGETGLLLGGPRHFLDMGFGLTYLTKDRETLLVPRIGYRYIGKRGFLIRASPAMYMINSNSESDSFGGYWLGVALGVGF